MVDWVHILRRRGAWVAACIMLLAAPAFALDEIPAVQPDYDTSSGGIMLPHKNSYFPKQKSVKGVAKMDKNAPLTMEADSMGFDSENHIAIAKGNVTVVQGLYVLKADQIIYYQEKNLVVAEGHVSALQPSGDIYFSDTAQMTDDMSQGIMQQFQARMTDSSVFAANEAHKINAGVTKLSQGTYTPCKLCDNLPPFWQLRANKIRVDEANEKITYHDASVELEGVPVLYTPYMSQPTPDSSAKSGFLTPEYFSNSNLGRGTRTPYYLRLSEDKDVTITPWFMVDQAWLLQGDYRQLTDHGNYSLQFSATDPDALDSNGNKTSGNEFRGHIYAKGVEDLTDDSRIGFDINRATDDTYLRRYGFGSQALLFSRAYAEADEQRNYIIAQAISIQGMLATDNSRTTPQVLPNIDGYYETKPDDNGIRYHVAGDVQALTRDIGASQNRVSSAVGASLPTITGDGEVITTSLNLRQDVYQLDDVPVAGEPDFTGTKARTIPQASLQWQDPLIKSTTAGDAITIEPIMLAVAQPTGENPVEIDNEDNTLVELSDTNIFSTDRMPGLDTVDSGSRVAYGARAQYLFAAGESIDGLLGQNYSFNDTPFPNSTTPGKHISDYIGRIGFDAQPVNIAYRFGLSPDSLAANRNEVSFTFNRPWLNLQADYRALNHNQYLNDSKEATLYAKTPLGEEWDIYGSGRRDLVLDQMIAAAMGIVYHNDCFAVTLQGLRNYTRDRDIEPDTQFTLRVAFKNIGEFGD